MKKLLLLLLQAFITYACFAQNVGIGTTNPEQQLSVAAGMSIDQNSLNTGTVLNTLRFGSLSGEAIGSKRNVGTNRYGLDFYTQGINRMTITNNGNIGINTLTPNAKLEIRGGALGFATATKRWELNYDSANEYFYIDEFGSGRRLSIKNGGNVGINTSDPQTTLDINGDLNVENRIFLNGSAGNSGQVIVSGGSGSASWRNTAFGTNDRFLLTTSNLSLTPGFSAITLFQGIYSNSSAITYSNGTFTINKTGLYGIEGLVTVSATVPESIQLLTYLTVIMEFFNPTLNHILFSDNPMEHVLTSGGTKFFLKTVPYSTKLYMTAGHSFKLRCQLSHNGASQFNILQHYPLSIYLISE